MLMKPTPEEIKINKYIRVLTYLGKILRENKKISSLFNLVKKKKKKSTVLALFYLGPTVKSPPIHT